MEVWLGGLAFIANAGEDVAPRAPSKYYLEETELLNSGLAKPCNSKDE